MAVALLRIIFLVSMGMNVSFGTTSQFVGTLNTLRILDGAVEQYQLEQKRLPTEAEGLVLVTEYVKGGYRWIIGAILTCSGFPEHAARTNIGSIRWGETGCPSQTGMTWMILICGMMKIPEGRKPKGTPAGINRP